MERPAIPYLRRPHFRLPAAMALGAAGALLALSTPLLAQDAGSELPKGNSPEEVAQRKAANDGQAKFAAGQLKANADSQAEYDRGLAAVEEAKAKIAADEAAAQSAYEAEKARRDQEYQAAMAKWRSDVEACKKGDVSRCAAAPAGQP